MLYGVRRCVVSQFGGAGRVRCHLPGGCPLCLVMLYGVRHGVRRCVVSQFGDAGRARCHLPGGCPLCLVMLSVCGAAWCHSLVARDACGAICPAAVLSV